MSKITEFSRVVHEMFKRQDTVQVTREEIERAFEGEITHHPMYFPMPGMPAPSDTKTDFMEWAKAQGYETAVNFENGNYYLRRANPIKNLHPSEIVKRMAFCEWVD